MRLLPCLILTLLLAACAGDKLEQRPPLAQRIVDLGQQGQAAYARGDLTRAARLFEQALAEALRIEASENVAIMAINLARVRREAGDSRRALATIESISPWHRDKLSARTTREMGLLAAVLLADVDRRDEARSRVRSLRGECASDCEAAIGLDSLRARLMLEQGEAAAAAQAARAAIERFRDHDNRLELANLLRTEGEASLALGNHLAAGQALENALSIDKALGQPAKIVQDLEALARNALAAGDRVAQAGYLARLDEVRRGRPGGIAK